MNNVFYFYMEHYVRVSLRHFELVKKIIYRSFAALQALNIKIRYFIDYTTQIPRFFK